MAAISIILLIVTIIVYYKTLFLFGLFAANFAGASDIIKMYFPFRNFFAISLRNGQFPLWTTDMFLGFPLHAEGQGGFLYPLNIPFAIFPSWVAYNYVFILHIFLSGFFAYIFIRTIGLKKTSSLLFSVVFSFSGFFAVHNEHMNLFNSAVWIPLVFLFIYKIKNKGVWIILGGVFAIQFLSGFPQIPYYSVIIGFIWLIFNTRRIRVIINYFLALVLGLFLAACQIIPTIELIPFSARSGGIAKSQVVSWGYFFKDLLLFIYPYIFGNPAEGSYIRKDSIFGENCAFVGVMVLLLCIFGLIKCFKNKNMKFFITMSVSIISIILLFPYLYKYLLQLPGMQYFRLPQRALVFVVMSLAFMAAWGFQELKRFRFLVFIVVLLELVNFSYGYNNIIKKDYLIEKPEVVKYLKKDSDLFRISVNDQNLKAWIYAYCYSSIPGLRERVQFMYRNYLPENFNMIYNVPSLNAYSPLVPEIKTKFTNVKYIISSSDLGNGNNLSLERKLDFNNLLPALMLYRDNNFYPRAFIKKQENYDKVTPVRITRYEAKKVVIEKDKNIDGYLYLCDFYYPGWEVFIDGVKKEIISFESIRKIKVFQDDRKIVFVYSPVSFLLGLLVSLFAVCFAVVSLRHTRINAN
ncbi:MAG: YfhO family protein [Elusimicrobia bacterium]|nr:YfhO family protein [Elusimicrobiota bacterium]